MSSHERLFELCGKCERVYERLERFSRMSGTNRITSKAFDVIRIVPAFSSHEPLIFTAQSASVDLLVKMERHQVAAGAFIIILAVLGALRAPVTPSRGLRPLDPRSLATRVTFGSLREPIL